ncbi:uncharacterized protein [Dermacentor andersoni]|uniref:uncharacterized protein n=1 Tax=Dermacentor andersoni TaxID=34620 RepID=UPI0021558116|nr:uncharacterized protein LOC126543222 [Dermacentor andersoni]
MAEPTSDFIVWQWNCRGLGGKAHTLQQYLRTHELKPSVILLQETFTEHIKIQGYRTLAKHSGGRGVAILVGSKLTFLQHDIHMLSNNIEYLMVEIAGKGQRSKSTFILNAYSSPKQHRQRFRAFLTKATHLAGSNPLLVAGAFNAPHPTWGYVQSTPKGNDPWEESIEAGLKLITDPTQPTRRGTSTNRDTTRDLAFTKNITLASWSNKRVGLGSDHYITAMTVGSHRTEEKIFKLVDRDKFRELSTGRSAEDANASLHGWMTQLQTDLEAATRTVTTDLETEKADSRLAHMLEAKQSLLQKWKGQRLSCRLRKKNAELNRSIEQRCSTLARQQWDEICNMTDGQVRRGGSWNLLKHLLDGANTNTSRKDAMSKLLYEACKTKTPDELVARLTATYLPVADAAATKDATSRYSGRPKVELDADFTTEEIIQALRGLNSRSAPGPDNITNKVLHNLDESGAEQLTAIVNEMWRSGKVPLE